MNESENSRERLLRTIAVDMSSEAITSRLREVGELCQLGTSLAKAKPCPPPLSQSSITRLTNEAGASDEGQPQ